jgi:hypothetical protein
MCPIPPYLSSIELLTRFFGPIHSQKIHLRAQAVYGFILVVKPAEGLNFLPGRCFVWQIGAVQNREA